MSICSYLVMVRDGATEEVSARISALPGCEVVPAENRDVLLLVAEARVSGGGHDLREHIEAMEGVRGLVLTFAQVDPDTEQADPLGGLRRRRRPTRMEPLA